MARIDINLDVESIERALKFYGYSKIYGHLYTMNPDNLYSGLSIEVAFIQLLEKQNIYKE